MMRLRSRDYKGKALRHLVLMILPLIIGIFVTFAFSAFSRSTAVAQEAGSSSSSQDLLPVSAQAADAQNADQSKQSAGEDSEAQFKHSRAVQYLARKTGMSLEHAYWLGVLINFAIVAGIIAWLAKKHLPELFRKRTFSIQKALEDARRASEDARRRLAEIESRLLKLDAQIPGMLADAEKEAAAEQARIKAAAEEDARRIVASAEQEIAAAVKSARRELTAYAADLAVSLAKKQIHVDDPTDQALVRGFAQQLTAAERQ
jgi:F-type H+-transporting ATPase subunit b